MSVIERFIFPCKLLLSALFCLLMAAALLVMFVPFAIIRLFVQLLAKIFRRDLNGMLKPSNVVLVNEDMYNSPEFNILMCSFIDSKVTVEREREKLMERVFGSLITNPRTDLEYEHLRNSITSFCNFWFWKKQKDFRIQDHVRTYEEVLEDPSTNVKLPIRSVYSENDLKTILSLLMTKPWKPDSSLWEIIILKNYVREESKATVTAKTGDTTNFQTVYIFRIHHCMADGLSLLHLMMKYNNYDDRDIVAIPSFRKQSRRLQFLLKILSPFKAFLDITVFLATHPYGSNGWTQAIKPEEDYTYTSTWTPQIPLERIRSLKNKYGVSFLAVIQGVSAGALRKMMIASGISVPKGTPCFIPFPLPNHRLGLRIHMATVVLNLHTGVEDGVDRVMKSQRTLVQKSRSLAPLVTLRFYNYVARMPKILSNMIVMPFITVGMSSFPGFTTQTHIKPDQHECSRIFFTLGIPRASSAACTITTFSSFGSIIFTFTIRNSLPLTRKQVEEFSSFIEEEISFLEDACNSKIIV